MKFLIGLLKELLFGIFKGARKEKEEKDLQKELAETKKENYGLRKKAASQKVEHEYKEEEIKRENEWKNADREKKWNQVTDPDRDK